MNYRNFKSCKYGYSHTPWTSLSSFDIFLNSNRNAPYTYSHSYSSYTLSFCWDYLILLVHKKILIVSASEHQWIFSTKN